MGTTVRIFVIVGLLAPLLAHAQDDRPPAYLDAEEGGLDFGIQGEYVYVDEFPEIGGEAIGPHGAQILALGKARFRIVVYKGGLPGAGWDGKKGETAEAEISDGRMTFRLGNRLAKYAFGTLAYGPAAGPRIARLEKTVRKSPTLGAKPPEGAVVLFDGSTADDFEGGRKTKDGLLMEGATSKRRFRDFTLHLEFRTPFMPTARGQARGNSGLYLQGRYEVQILDSYALEGLDNECGGIYRVARPKVNACFPPLAWQTYDVEFTAPRYERGKKTSNARVTVRQNGILIHEDVELPKPTAAFNFPEGSDPGPIFLQDHGNPVRFRNIWVVEER